MQHGLLQLQVPPLQHLLPSSECPLLRRASAVPCRPAVAVQCEEACMPVQVQACYSTRACLENSCLAASRASSSSNCCRRFSRRRVAGVTSGSTRWDGAILSGSLRGTNQRRGVFSAENLADASAVELLTRRGPPRQLLRVVSHCVSFSMSTQMSQMPITTDPVTALTKRCVVRAKRNST